MATANRRNTTLYRHAHALLRLGDSTARALEPRLPDTASALRRTAVDIAFLLCQEVGRDPVALEAALGRCEHLLVVASELGAPDARPALVVAARIRRLACAPTLGWVSMTRGA